MSIDLREHIDNFQRRVIEDAITSSRGATWLRRASAFEAAAPRPDDFRGRATPEEIEVRRRRLKASALACRRHAGIMSEGIRDD